MAAATIPAMYGRANTPWKTLPALRPKVLIPQRPSARRPGPESVQDSFSQQEVRPVTRIPPQQPGQDLSQPLEPDAALASKTQAERAAAAAEQAALNELAARCLAGDAAAWEQLARSQHRRVYGICYRFTGSQSDAEDLTQEAFLKMYRNLASFDPARGGFTTWLTTLTRNLLVDNYRRTRLERASDSLDESYDGEEGGATKADRLADTGRSQEQHVAGLELRAQIQAALKQVSPELREAVILRDLEDMDYKEIAEVLGVPQGTVKSRISRGRAELARLLKRIEGQVM